MNYILNSNQRVLVISQFSSFQLLVCTNFRTWLCSNYKWTRGRSHAALVIKYAVPSPQIVGRKVGNIRREISGPKATVGSSAFQ